MKKSILKIFIILLLLLIFSVLTTFLYTINKKDTVEMSGTPKSDYETIFEDEDIIIKAKVVEALIQGEAYYPDELPLKREQLGKAIYDSDYDLKDYATGRRFDEFNINDTVYKIEVTNEDERIAYEDILNIYKNGTLIWTKQFAVTTYDPLSSLTVFEFNNALFIDYQASVYDNVLENYEVANTILIITPSGITDLAEKNSFRTAYEPYLFNEKLLYFADKELESFLVWDGSIILEGMFENITNAKCCEPAGWSILGKNDLGVDFFARKGEEIFHIYVEPKVLN